MFEKYNEKARRALFFARYEAVAGSNCYIAERFQPDKSVDVMDEAGARVKLRRVRDATRTRRIETGIRRVVAEMKAAISDKDFERAVRCPSASSNCGKIWRAWNVCTTKALEIES